MRTSIYVDGFNFYYGALKRTAYKWLNLQQLAQKMLPNNTITEIKYFTAHVSSRSHDPDQGTRQQAYIRALKTIPNLSVILGRFLTNECMMPLAQVQGKQQFVKVIKTEEKGSDVNIAVHLINDAYQGRFDVAVLITNDSDLCEAIKIVRSQLALTVGLLNPHAKPSHALQKEASFVKSIRKGVLATSQFPDVMLDSVGTFTKPKDW
ncbi:NYN domain-containing protein [Herpetosiphon gulosus]|uniref:6-hydroxy-3-succinoylpyridine 3-monooxygenase HspA n=1 Tax=Herpetosiphon gulosus TaxID=1973496 RepID=A0ABP9X311_9CHLR